jgi:hypothetical protein
MQTYTEYTQAVEENLSRLNTATVCEFTHGWTGGNCDAYFLNDGDNYYMVTVGGEAIAPTTPEEWEEVTLGYYTLDNDGGDIVESVRTFADVVQFFKVGGY